jgi:hypothetical protein
LSLFSFVAVSQTRIKEVNKNYIYFETGKNTKKNQRIVIVKGKKAIAFCKILSVKGNRVVAVIDTVFKGQKVKKGHFVKPTNKSVKILKETIHKSTLNNKTSFYIGGPFIFSSGLEYEKLIKKNHSFGFGGFYTMQTVKKVENSGYGTYLAYSYFLNHSLLNSFYIGLDIGYISLSSTFTNIDGVADFSVDQSGLYSTYRFGYQYKMEEYFYGFGFGFTQAYFSSGINRSNGSVITNPMADTIFSAKLMVGHAF